MSKIITSPVKRFPGTVTMPDFLTFDQYSAYKKTITDIQESGVDSNSQLLDDWVKVNHLMLPVILACVEKWDIKGIDNPQAKFPATPREPAAILVRWLFNNIHALVDAEDDVPLA